MSTAIQHSILLVEDDLRLAELVSRYLANHGFTMTIVSRGDEVVERVQHDNPDLVILDLGLPGEDGFSICRHLRPAYCEPDPDSDGARQRHRSRVGPGARCGRLRHQARRAAGAAGADQRAAAAEPGRLRAGRARC